MAADYAKEEGDPGVISTLAKHGRELMLKAYGSSTPDIITGNQNDAFGYAVYYNGQLKRKGDVGSTAIKPEPDKKRGKSGLSEARRAPRRYHPSAMGYVLLVYNAMWYSSAHEYRYGPGRLGTMKVVQQIAPQLYTIAGKYEARVEFINFGW